MVVKPEAVYSLPRNLVLAASAGTGKTHALVGVVIHLLLLDRVGTGQAAGGPVDPSRIVATTFSRKAAAEIRIRVTRELERLASAPETSAYVDSLRVVSRGVSGGGGGGAQGRGGARAHTDGLSDDELRLRASRALSRLPSARFGTLHSFATGIVRAHAVELGLGPGFDLATEPDARALADEAIGQALEVRLRTHETAVRALAEAAGGIEQLVDQMRRVLVRLEEDGRAASDLSIASNDAEAIERELQTLVAHAQALQGAPRFEAAARDLVSAWQGGDDLTIEAAATALCALPALGKKTPEVEAFAVFRKALAGATNDEKGRRLARAYRVRHRFGEYAHVARDVLGSAEAAIERAGRARAAIGFGEILRAARELLRDRTDVADEVGGGIDALLVDEFQDTSRVQRDLLQLLWARRGTREPGRVPPISAVRDGGLLVVGDRKQSIYGFRGADVGVFAELAVGLAGAPAREALGILPGVTWEPPEPLADFCALRQNRRSVPEVLVFANAFSARRFRPGDPPPALYEIDYVPATEDLLVPPERARAAPTEEAPPSPHATWLRVNAEGASSTRLEEALVVAAKMRSIVADGTLLLGSERRRATWRDLAVLATTNTMLDAVAFALAQSEIPYVVAGKSFFGTREVRDLGAMLELVLDPSDRLAALEVLRGPWTGVHDETLIALTRPGEGLAPVHAWPAASHAREEDRASLADVAALVSALARSAGRLGPGAILREAVRARRLDEVLAGLPRGDQRVANVRKLLAIADRHTDARAFSAWLADAWDQELAESEAATFSEDDDAVRLLTIHASKGLDFPVVFVPEIGAPLPRLGKGALRISLGAGDEPNVLSVRAADDTGMVLEPPSFERAYAAARRRDRAERQRLAYVAVTRAKDALFLVGGRAREGTGDVGASTLGALEEMAGADRAALAVEDVDVPPPVIRRPDDPPEPGGASPSVPTRKHGPPAWSSLPIAPTALADFDYCARRFELVHLLGLPEHLRGARAPEPPPLAPNLPALRESAPRDSHGLDARAQGTLAHAVLERVPTSAFAGEEADVVASRALAAEGIPPTHVQHAVIVARVTRFLRGSFAQAIAASGATLRREVAFVLSVSDPEGRAVVLRGSMDLVVLWPDGTVDVVDYKSARSGAEGAYGFQLDVYALAAREMFPSAPRLRAGLVYLGGAGSAGEPIWRTLPLETQVRASIAAMGDRLVQARWSGAFPRVELERCEAIHCGFIGRCHASATPAAPAAHEEPPRSSSVSGDGEENGTEANEPPATTT